MVTATTADQRTLWPGYVYPGVWDPAQATHRSHVPPIPPILN
jgi:hypothetical protein